MQSYASRVSSCENTGAILGILAQPLPQFQKCNAIHFSCTALYDSQILLFLEYIITIFARI